MAITAKQSEIDMWLQLDIDMKSYIGSPMLPLDLTLSDLERPIFVGHPDFDALYLVKELR